MKIDIQKAFAALSDDSEFRREIRYFNGTLKMNMGRTLTLCCSMTESR